MFAFFPLQQTQVAIFSSKLTNLMAAIVLWPGLYLDPYNSGIHLVRRAAMGALCYQLLLFCAQEGGWSQKSRRQARVVAVHFGPSIALGFRIERVQKQRGDEGGTGSLKIYFHFFCLQRCVFVPALPFVPVGLIRIHPVGALPHTSESKDLMVLHMASWGGDGKSAADARGTRVERTMS